MALVSTSTSTFLYCTPLASTATVTSTVYTTTLPAACETGIWEATYTITDFCFGSCAGYAFPLIPPGFGVTTVHCPVCPTQDIVVTCPTSAAATATGPGGLPVPQVEGNGVTMAPTPTVTVYNPGCVGENCPAPTYPPGAVQPGAGAGGAPGSGAPGAGAPGSGAGAAPGSGSGSPAAGAGAGAAAPNASTAPGTGAGGSGSPPIVVAGANSVSRSLGLISGLAAIAGYVYLL